MARETKIWFNEQLLMADLYHYAHVFSEEVAKQASKSIKSFAQEAITTYYSGYSPYNYIRTGQLAKESYYPFTEKIKTEYQGGIVIDTSNVNYPEHGPNVTTDEIVAWSWTQGFHGVYYGNKESMYNGTKKINLYDTYGHGYIKGNPDIKPYDWVRRKVYNPKFKRDLMFKAKTYARQQKYGALHFN